MTHLSTRRQQRRRSHLAQPLLLLLCLLAGAAQPLRAGESSIDAESREALELQLALEREGYSPGVIDAKAGAKTALALREFQRSRSIPVSGTIDEATAAALGLRQREVLTTYMISSSDQAKVTGRLPTNWNAKAKLPYLGYPSLVEAICERFHCSPGLLSRLNPGASLSHLKVGDVLIVPYIAEAKTPRIDRLEINLAQKVIRGFDSQGRVAALFHCSIAKEVAKRPVGQARVRSIVLDPSYNFDPAMWPEVRNVRQKLTIQPGPRNPVGLCWIGLSLKGYGIHGTPNPELIGKTGSHGCFRLTNWDAIRLAKMVQPGTPVVFAAR